MNKTLFSEYKPKNKWLVCIDSDGCAFDTMEIKHKECFCPSTIHKWGLQPISKYAREAWEYGNLYSKDRGRTRFHEILILFDLLVERKEVQDYGFVLPDIEPLRQWIKTSPALNNADLAKHDNPVLAQTLDWSLDCNRRIAEMVYGIPPFPGVRESLQKLAEVADIAIVSATARESLEHEWNEHGLMDYISQLCAQEDGSKSDCISALAVHYAPGNVLMIGDAPGDMEAAQKSGVLFYPIIPGNEIASWHEFVENGADKFLSGNFAGDYEAALLQAFDESLPDVPPWKK